MSRVSLALSLYLDEHRRYPTAETFAQLQRQIEPQLAITDRGNFRMARDKSGHLVDGWYRKLALRPASKRMARWGFIIYSPGSDGIDDRGENDDLVEGLDPSFYQKGGLKPK